MIDRHRSGAANPRTASTLGVGLAPGLYYRAAVLLLAAWILCGFLEAMLAACITAIASWPLYQRFANRMPARLRRRSAPLGFTVLMVAFVLAPLVFAFAALLGELRTLGLDIAAADQQGIDLPRWLENVPLLGPWLMVRWQTEVAHPGALLSLVQQADLAVVLGWAQSLGRFTARHAIVVLFAILLLFFLYQQGDELAQGCRRVLRQRLGAGVENYVDLGTRAVRASVNSMLVVGLFDGLAAAVAFVVLGVPQPVVWAAITGTLALVPFLGYLAVVALAFYLTVTGSAATALLALALGSAILLVGDKALRPAVAGAGVGLPFVWVLIGCLGGFEALGVVGLVVGPVVLSLVRELWEQRVRDATSVDAIAAVAAELARPGAAAAPVEAQRSEAAAAVHKASTHSGSRP